MRHLALALVLLVASPAIARAEGFTVGLFAPTAPFPSTSARVELASRLAEHLGNSINKTGSGKVFARGADFAAAAKKGEVSVAVVDAAYLAVAGGNYTLLASATRNGESVHGWQIVARGADKLAGLKGKRVLVPAIGGRETELVLNVLLGGEVAKDYFAKIETAPDTVSALAALGLGKVDAVVVPRGTDLPAGAAVVLELPALAGPVLVAYGTLSAADKTSITNAALSFKGDATVSGFKAADPDAIKSVARRFTVPAKRGPLALPAIRLLVGDLVEGRTFAIERTPVTAFATKPR
ncbi:MAG TPA: PhnD/SsuA/transferrin family substrate-binding protein [Kofleriaceae bacterium]|nr:PhnD/SsuA/transferrin family substrate-binding protein [Kofleriaceae bacterium]